jgi:hypothetical protein
MGFTVNSTLMKESGIFNLSFHAQWDLFYVCMCDMSCNEIHSSPVDK